MTVNEQERFAARETGNENARFRDVPRYLWLVFASAFLAWMFDAMDLNVFTLILRPSVSDLLGTKAPGQVAATGGLITAVKLFGWGIGGVVFGFAADRFGRARIMTITIVMYGAFTALSAAAASPWQLALFQALAGLGIGGEWAAGAALLAETWPERLRPKIMQLMQMAFAFGFIVAAVINFFIGPFGWRWVLLTCLFPVFLTIGIRLLIREPERWVAARRARHQEQPRGSSARLAGPRRLFGKDLRRGTVVGILISLAMMVGSWGGLTWIPSWIGQLLAHSPHADPSKFISYTFMIMMGGAIIGYVALMWLADIIGRRLSYFLFCLGALVASLALFLIGDSAAFVFAFAPVYGFFVIGGFGAFAVYLPELFPTIVRASGQGLCWNIARIVTGFGVLGGGALVSVTGSYPTAAAMVASVFVIGLIAIWFGSETRGRALRDV